MWAFVTLALLPLAATLPAICVPLSWTPGCDFMQQVLFWTCVSDQTLSPRRARKIVLSSHCHRKPRIPGMTLSVLS